MTLLPTAGDYRFGRIVYLANSVGKVEFSQTQATLADVDGSKGITAGDALLILQKAVGKLESFPSEDI